MPCSPSLRACHPFGARTFGSAVGGLFLGFPAILPASLTLVKKHEGEEAAGDDVAGAVAGSIGLIAFGALVWALAARLTRGSWSLLLPGRSSPCAEAHVGLMCPGHRAIKA